MRNSSDEVCGLKTAEFDLQGLSGIRLLNAAPADAAIVRRPGWYR
jgi:hypothetical protein